MINPRGRPNVSEDNTIRPEEQRLVDGIALLKATEGELLPEHVPGRLSPEHAIYLERQAVDVELAERLGVRSLFRREDNPQEGHWPNFANHPAILFPWTSPSGRVEYQVRPDNPTASAKGGRLRKYLFRKGMEPVLWAVRPVDNPKRVLIVEGTKQCLAAASYAPDDVAVYGIAGCRMWQVDGSAIPDLMVVDGQDVVVILDADAADNTEVYQAGVELAAALALEGANKVLFTRMSATGTSGLDDVLGHRPPSGRRSYLKRMIDGAKAKPADAKPKGKKSGEAPTGEGGRVTIVVNRDRWAVINELTGAMLSRWNARELFSHGGVISRRMGSTMEPVDRGSFHNLVQETAITVNENEGANGTTYSFSWPDPGTMAATMSRSNQFAPLDRISHAPFVRPDGTIVTEPGYDEGTRTLLMADPVFEGLTIPENPTREQVLKARDLLLNDWLGDFPFDSDVDRANALALLITPAIRGMVPKVPLCVIDGLQMGVGKNLLADSLLTVYTGSAAEPMNWVPDPDELRKQITSAFRTGSEFFVFDEAHTVEGAPLAQALTASTWQDRILGVSTMANFPNVITWISLGNQVQVKGDLTRRVYRIALRPTYANPQDRPSSSFRHPGQSGLDLGSWTRANRRELMGAILTLVRAWFAQGQPRPTRGVSFGSFEVWERITGGIIETAGMEGFLANLTVWRSESDFDTQYWTGHLGWLRATFGDQPFRTAEVRSKALADPAGYMAPPKLDDPSDKAYGKGLGEAYSRLRGRRYGSLWIERSGFAHGHVTVWTVGDNEDLPPAPGTGGPEPVVPPRPVDGPVDNPEPDAPENEHADGESQEEVRPEPDSEESTSLEADILAFDLETGDAGDLYKRGPGFVRIGATAADDREVVTYAPGIGSGPKSQELVAHAVAHDIRSARLITGHNIMAFDLPALVRAGTMTMPEVHTMAADGKIFDALLAARFLDPPMARDKGVDTQRKYDLGALGEKYELGAKMTDVSGQLHKKYGGWDQIPIDDSEDGRAFKAYMVQDVELSRRLHARLLTELGGTVPEYLVREHRVAAIGAQISVNGFLMDQQLLTERMTEVNERKAGSLAWLAEHAGIPLASVKGVPYKSPLASAAGKTALEEALRAAGATSIWRTPKSGDLDTSGEHMKHLAAEYHHLPEVRKIAAHVYRIVGARSVYQTAHDHLGPDGRVHPRVSFQQATGRWSVTQPGLTVFGKRGGRHVERAVFLPDPGEVLISADLSQVDMRALAGLSQDLAYIEMLKHDDPHSEIALALFGDVKRREDAKAIGHGWNYGRGIKAISEGSDIDPALVRRFDTSMRERFPRLIEWQAEVRAVAESGALLDNGFGRLMRADPQRAHTQAPALMGQGAARDIMMAGLLRLDARILPMLRAQVHDEIVLSVPEGEAEEVGRAVVEALSFEWRGVPILADVSRTGTDWSKCYEKG
jgi:DNA polymerase I-like protein with 3'-5' exonuclease and polymerase domains